MQSSVATYDYDYRDQNPDRLALVNTPSCSWRSADSTVLICI